MATKTSLLGLTKPEGSDKVQVSVINDNMDIIDYATQRRDRVWNLLDNSDFRNPVNQRGLTTYTGVDFTIDRWRTWSEGAVTVREGYISHETAIYQTIATKLDTTKKYTYAAMNTDNVITVVSGFITNDLWQNGMHLIYNEGKPYVRIEPEAHLKNVVWAALYEGEYTAETLPAYVPKGYAAELMECRRYYYEFDALVSSESSGIGAPRRMFVTLPVPMRQIPDVTYAVSGGNAPHEITMQSNTTVDIASADQGYSHLRVKLSADL